MARFCANCGTPLPDGAAFCGGCGRATAPPQAAAAPPPPPAPTTVSVTINNLAFLPGTVTVSAGFAVCPVHGKRGDQVFQAADQALLTAKQMKWKDYAKLINTAALSTPSKGVKELAAQSGVAIP